MCVCGSVWQDGAYEYYHVQLDCDDRHKLSTCLFPPALQYQDSWFRGVWMYVYVGRDEVQSLGGL